MEIQNTNKDSWNKHAERYQNSVQFSFDNVDFGSIDSKTEKDLKLIGDVKDKKVLELGCGGANCGIALAKQGAIVTCVDISEEQIKYARQNADREKVTIHFIVSAMEDVELGDNEYDVVISMAALGYIKNIEAVFHKVQYVLKEKGIFVCSPPNAIYSCVMAKYLFHDPVETHSYFYTGPTKWKWEEEDGFEFVTYCRPISEYINLLIDNGLYIMRVHELQERQEHTEDRTDEFDVLYPKVLVIKSIKLSGFGR
jgi:2-polyprenyl-3-methyl-5-hydroxy-6-metoxy-1,4-benzoquinol methylase